jgi:hypothetical protein
VENPVENLWKTCGKPVENFPFSFFSKVIHKLSTSFPHSYPQFFHSFFRGFLRFRKNCLSPTTTILYIYLKIIIEE